MNTREASREEDDWRNSGSLELSTEATEIEGGREGGREGRATLNNGCTS